MTISALAAEFIAGNQSHTSGDNGRVTRVVIHATVSPCERGGSRGNARYFQSAGAGGLAHYVVDPGEIIACCDEDVACWHAPPNHGSIGIELCDPQTGDDWGDDDHQAMLQLAAELVRDICSRHGLPIVWLTPSELLAGATGITGHAQVAQAWHKTDHTDPGQYFPADAFIALVGDGHQTPPEDDLSAQAEQNIQELHNAIFDDQNGMQARLARVEAAVGQSDPDKGVQTGLAGAVWKARRVLKAFAGKSGLTADEIAKAEAGHDT